jgi:hypothetical protein
MPPRRSLTAAEAIRELAADPEYQARLREQAAQREQLARACAADEADLVAELRAAGSLVASVWDLAGTGGATGAGIGILVAHLDRPHHPCIWEGIVRGLATKAARAEALEPLRRQYRTEAEPSRRWVLANAIGTMAKFSEVQDLDGIAEYRALFRQSRKPPHAPPAT